MKKIRLNPGYLIQQIGTDKVLIPCGINVDVDYSKMVVLNEAAALMVGKMRSVFVPEEELIEELMLQYEVDYACVAQDVSRFLDELQKQGMLQIEE